MKTLSEQVDLLEVNNRNTIYQMKKWREHAESLELRLDNLMEQYGLKEDMFEVAEMQSGLVVSDQPMDWIDAQAFCDMYQDDSGYPCQINQLTRER